MLLQCATLQSRGMCCHVHTICSAAVQHVVQYLIILWCDAAAVCCPSKQRHALARPGSTQYDVVTMFTIGGDLLPDCLADRLLLVSASRE
jgi:hypothetical protein